jgi:protein-S-isoprenylcysteine O-methyltransferase Ste14
MRVKTLISVAAQFVLLAVLVFLPAGTLRWQRGWIFLGILYTMGVAVVAMLARHDPDLLEERLHGTRRPGQKGWDRTLMRFFTLMFFCWMPLMGLDAIRFRWSSMPPWLGWVGAAGLALSCVAIFFTFRVNSYLSPVARIQVEREQRVISSGPYALVRHPLYASLLLLLSAAPLLLGSWYGLAGAVLPQLTLVLRAALEDRMLHAELDGYAGYASRVPARLIPGVW